MRERPFARVESALGSACRLHWSASKIAGRLVGPLFRLSSRWSRPRRLLALVAAVAVATAGAVILQGPVARDSRAAATQLRPVLGRTVVVAPVRGTLYVRQPGGERARLTAPLLVPVRSLLDATHGTARLTTARRRRCSPRSLICQPGEKRRTQSAIFSGTRFQIFQRRRRNPSGLTTVRLRAELACRARAGSHASASRNPRVKLHGKAKGHYKTQTGKGAGVVRGTIWDTIDTCRYTDFVVRAGRVAVVDFGKTDSPADDRRDVIQGPGARGRDEPGGPSDRFRARGRHSSATVRGGFAP
jgi:hypothetical protein